jgi:hypothetical protein
MIYRPEVQVVISIIELYWRYANHHDQSVKALPRPDRRYINRWYAGGEWHVVGERLGAIAECPRCFRRIELYQDIDAWEPDTGRIVDWGPSQGVCEECHLLIVDYWDGSMVFDLRRNTGA